MARTLTETEAQTHFSQIITDACNGEDIVIARENIPLIRLMPIAEHSHRAKKHDLKGGGQTWEEKVSAIKALRKKAVIGPPMTIEDIISARDEGRK